MAAIMTKQGNLDNIITYEHICDTFEDIQTIDPHYITLGSTCVVINGESGGLEVYMANSNKEWESLSVNSGSGGESSSLPIQILSTDDIDEETGEPNINTPIENTFYLTPSSEEGNDMFDEWIYVNDGWEKFGSGGAHVNIPVPDWNVETYGADGYINNKPSIKKGTANWSIAEGRDTIASSIAAHAEGSSSIASGANSHAEGVDTTASGASAHAEGRHTIAASNYQHVFGEYNVADNDATYVEIVGNGDSNARANARTLDWSGNEWLAGSLTLNQTTLTENNLQNLLNIPTQLQTKLDINNLKNFKPYKYFNTSSINCNTSITGDLDNLIIYGKTYQENVPSVENPVPIQEVGSNNIINITNNTNTINISIPDGLYGIPVTNGNYKDETGQQWVSDTIDFNKKKYIKRVGKIIIDGNFDWVKSEAAENTYCINNFNTIIPNISGSTQLISNLFSRSFTVENNKFHIGVNELQLITTTDVVSTVEEYKELLNTTPLVMYYVLPTVIENNLTFSQLAALDSIKAFNTNTTINITDTIKPNISVGIPINIPQTLDESIYFNIIQNTGEKAVYIDKSDVSITAKENTRYICGEVSTLNFTPSATGICDIRFTSGSQKTILTLPNTVKMPDWFEVEANTTYEISIEDGVYGVVASWPV